MADLDDTLVSTTKLNNDAYNFALETLNYKTIISNNRLTRENFNFLSKEKLELLKKLKQQYFCMPWIKYRTIQNFNLFQIIKSNKKENNFIWTKADRCRTYKMFEALNLNKYFNDIIFDTKENFERSINLIKCKANSKDFIIYENNFKFFENSPAKEIFNLKNEQFNIKGYLIST